MTVLVFLQTCSGELDPGKAITGMTYLQTRRQFAVAQKAQYDHQHRLKSPIGEKLAQGDLLCLSASTSPDTKSYPDLLLVSCIDR